MTSRTLPMARSSICCRVMTLVDCGVSRCDSTRPLADRIQSAVYRPEPSVVAPAPSTTTGANCAASAPARRSSKSPSARRCACKEVPASNASNPPARHGCPAGRGSAGHRPGRDRTTAVPGPAARSRPAPRPAGQPAHWPGRARGGRGRLCMAWAAASAAPANAAMTSATPVFMRKTRGWKGAEGKDISLGSRRRKSRLHPYANRKRKSDSPACVFRLCRAARPNSGYSAAPAPARRARQRPAHDRCPPGEGSRNAQTRHGRIAGQPAAPVAPQFRDERVQTHVVGI